MKYFIPALFLLLISCGSDDASHNKTSTLEVGETGVGGPKEGTIVAADSMRIPDPLNEKYFSVKVVATAYSYRGTYAVKATYGMNDATSEITLPHSSNPLTPALRKGDEPYSYIVGFRIDGSDTFYDYFLVSAQRGQTEMKYLKAYQLP